MTTFTHLSSLLRRLLALVAAAAVFCCAFAESPRPYVTVDLTSAYLWRGQKNAGVSIQPVLGIGWKGLDFYIWGNEQLAPGKDPATAKTEIDWFLKYQLNPNFNIGFKDVYVSNRGRGFFSFGHIPHAANGLDVLLTYSCRWFTADWSTTIAGYDGYDHHGHRAYGSYLDIHHTWHWMYMDWTPTVGIVPYYCSRYSDDDSHGFHVNMTALKAAHTFDLRANTSLNLYTQLMVNPSSRKAFFQVGAKFAFRP